MMIKQKYIIIALFFLLLPTVLGYADITYHFNVDNVKVSAYDCLDQECSAVSSFSGSFPDGRTTSNGELTIIFPSTLASKYGYALFFVSPGYVPMEYRATWHTYGNDGHAKADFNIDFYKIKNCHSTIDSFSITNDVYTNMPLIINLKASLDATTYSAFTETDTGVKYVPPEYRDEFYSADTRITLSIYNSEGNLVNKQTKVYSATNGNPLYMDESRDVKYTWTPELPGEYTAVVETEVIDDQCSSSLKESSSKEFMVLSDLPQNECYTILNELRTDNPYPVEGNQVVVSYTKISNYADSTTALTPVGTSITYSIINDFGDVVHEESSLLPANPDSTAPYQYDFVWVPHAAGWYTIKVEGLANSALCEGLPNSLESIHQRIYVKKSPTYNLTFQVVDATNGSSIENALVDLGINFGFTDSNGRLTLEGFAPDVYSYTVTHPGYETLSGEVEVLDTNLDIFLVMTPKQQEKPACSNGLDDDGDGFVDFPADPGCVSLDDDDEFNEPVVCFVDSDCGVGGFVGGSYCVGDVVVRDFVSFGCGLAGTVDAYCFNSTSRVVVERCEFGCRDGVCITKEKQRGNVLIKQIRVLDYYSYSDEVSGDSILAIITLHNPGRAKLEKLELTVSIPELAVWKRIGPFDLNGKETLTKQILVKLPSYVKPGIYDVRFSLHNKDIHRIKYRPVGII